MRTIIVGKNRLRQIEDYIEKCSQLKFAGSFDPESAGKVIAEKDDIDLIFLDSNAAGKSLPGPGRKNAPAVVIISSAAAGNIEYTEAADYLVLPVTFERFSKVVVKIASYYQREKADDSGQKEITVKKGATLIDVKFRDIIYAEAVDNHTCIHTINEKYRIQFTLNAFENIVPSGIFTRVNGSFIVNKSMLSYFNKDTLEIKTGLER
jgi:DNA-binding LytR/AlgR family response regulator